MEFVDFGFVVAAAAANFAVVAVFGTGTVAVVVNVVAGALIAIGVDDKAVAALKIPIAFVDLKLLDSRLDSKFLYLYLIVLPCYKENRPRGFFKGFLRALLGTFRPLK